MKKKFLSKKWCIVLIVLFVLFIISCTSKPTEDNENAIQNTMPKEQNTEAIEENTNDTTETEDVVEKAEVEDVVKDDIDTTEIIESTNDIEIHIYDNAQLKNVMNGIRTEKIGEYSIIKALSSEVTDEALTDWYFNYVEKNNYNFYIILYSDSDECKGVYAINGFVEKDVFFTEDEYGDYSLSDVTAEDEAIVYVPTETNILEKLNFE